MRTLPALGAALIAAFALAACGSSDDDPAAPPAAAAGDAFPVTVEHRFGSTEIPEPPERIVTLGYTDQDAYIALGTVPVAVTDWMGFGSGVGPWAEPLLEGAQPQVLKDTDGIPFEQIAAQRPDVISALYSGLSRKDYGTLSKIAPVVVAPAGTKNWGITWQDTVRAAGTVLGRSDEASQVVADVEGEIDAAAEAHPEFAGKQASMAMYFEGYWVYGPTDPRSQLLQALGFELPPDLADATGDEYAVEISRERLPLLDLDALIWLNTEADQRTVDGDRLYTDLDVHAEGRDLATGTDMSEAIGFVSALSLPYTVEKIVPALAAAVDGDPETSVPIR